VGEPAPPRSFPSVLASPNRSRLGRATASAMKGKSRRRASGYLCATVSQDSAVHPNSCANAVTSLLHAEGYNQARSERSQRPLGVAPARDGCSVCSANLRCRRRRVRIVKHAAGGRKRRPAAQARAVHARARRSELPRPQLHRRADHPQRHQHERSRLQIRPTSLRQTGTKPRRPGDIVGEQKAAVARTCQMHALARGTQLRRPDKLTTAAQQRQRRRRQRLVPRARNRAGATRTEIQTSGSGVRRRSPLTRLETGGPLNSDRKPQPGGEPRLAPESGSRTGIVNRLRTLASTKSAPSDRAGSGPFGTFRSGPPDAGRRSRRRAARAATSRQPMPCLGVCSCSITEPGP